MLEEVAAFLRADLGEERSDRAVEARDGALGGLAQQRFDFAEGLLDRIELRRILRQVHYFRANRFDRFFRLDIAQFNRDGWIGKNCLMRNKCTWYYGESPVASAWVDVITHRGERPRVVVPDRPPAEFVVASTSAS
jgi:hypothetical protein